MILRFLFYAFLLYITYKLVFNLILPVYRTTKRVKAGFREMQERMQQTAGSQEQQTQPSNPVSQNSRPRQSEYIDFEEVK